MNRRPGIPGLLLAILLLFPADLPAKGTKTATPAHGTTLSTVFPRPPALEERIAFWKQLFTEYSEHQIVIHDERHVEKVYSVLDVRSASRRQIGVITEQERRRIRTILLRLHGHGENPAGLSPEEWKIFEIWQDLEDPKKFQSAAYRIHAQPGLRNQFAAGLRVSRRYLAQMERIFHDQGVPAELTRLPLIESCFDLRAFSHKGAAGIWQFMPTTGRLYGLRIDRLIDERRDPILATRAAARYLASNHRQLGSWPLAITAYNHGGRGIARAVRALGSSDIADLVERYRGRSFGFAGQNFYAEFLAALDIDRHPERYFAELTFDNPLPAEFVPVPYPLSLTEVAKAAGVPRDEIAALNPSLGSRIVRRGAYVPRGYEVRVPAGKKQKFEGQLSALAAAHAARMARASTHRVKSGETLSHIAKRYGTSVKALQNHNGIGDARRLRAGQLIRIPRDGDGSITAASAQSKTATRTLDVRHRVGPGQTLSHIAKKYGTSVRTLESHNGISDARRLRAGQVIRVPQRDTAGIITTASARSSTSGAGKRQLGSQRAGSETSATKTVDVRHRVRRGQTLSHIARRYGTSVGTLKSHNGIRDARSLRAGQLIAVPGSAAGQVVASADQSSSTGYIWHRVRRGQTLSHIARKYGTSVSTLKRHNGIRDARRLQALQVIKIPTG